MPVWIERRAGRRSGLGMDDGDYAAGLAHGSNVGKDGVGPYIRAQATNGQAERMSLSSQRRWPRFAVDMPVQVRVTTQGPTRVVACHGQGTDLSCGGVAGAAGDDPPTCGANGRGGIPP